MSRRASSIRPGVWRRYRGCRCFDQRTGAMRASVRECACPVAVPVGQRRERLLARQLAASPVATRRSPGAALGCLLRRLWGRLLHGGAEWLRGMP